MNPKETCTCSTNDEDTLCSLCKLIWQEEFIPKYGYRYSGFPGYGFGYNNMYANKTYPIDEDYCY